MWHSLIWDSGSFLLQVQIPGLENLQVFVPDTLAEEKNIILQLLNAAAGKDCSKESDDVLIDAYLLLTKQSDRARDSEDSWASWEVRPVKIVPQVETVDTLRSMQVCVTASSCSHCSHPCVEVVLVTKKKIVSSPWVIGLAAIVISSVGFLRIGLNVLVILYYNLY